MDGNSRKKHSTSNKRYNTQFKLLHMCEKVEGTIHSAKWFLRVGVMMKIQPHISNEFVKNLPHFFLLISFYL